MSDKTPENKKGNYMEIIHTILKESENVLYQEINHKR